MGAAASVDGLFSKDTMALVEDLPEATKAALIEKINRNGGLSSLAGVEGCISDEEASMLLGQDVWDRVRAEIGTDGVSSAQLVGYSIGHMVAGMAFTMPVMPPRDGTIASPMLNATRGDHDA